MGFVNAPPPPARKYRPTCNLTRQVHFGTEAGAAIGAYSNTVNYSIRARLCTKILYDPLNNLVTDGMLHVPYAFICWLLMRTHGTLEASWRAMIWNGVDKLCFPPKINSDSVLSTLDCTAAYMCVPTVGLRASYLKWLWFAECEVQKITGIRFFVTVRWYAKTVFNPNQDIWDILRESI